MPLGVNDNFAIFVIDCDHFFSTLLWWSLKHPWIRYWYCTIHIPNIFRVR